MQENLLNRAAIGESVIVEKFI